MDGTYKFYPDGIFAISKNDVELQPSENKGNALLIDCIYKHTIIPL